MSGIEAPPPTDTPAAPAPLLGGAPTTPPAGSAPQSAADPRDWLPEEYRADKTFEPIKDVAALAKSYKHAATMVGLDKGQVLRIPAGDDPEQMAAVFSALGRPEKPDGYEFPELPGRLMDGMEPAIRDAFHQAGLSATQAKATMGLYGTLVQQAQQQRIAKANEIEAAVVADLQKEWGDAFDERVTAANRVINEIGGEDLARWFQTTELADGTRIGLHPQLTRLLAELGTRIAEPTGLKGPGSVNGARALTPGEAQAEIQRLKADPEFGAQFRDKSHPLYPEHKAKWDRLHLAAYPTAQ